MKRNDYLKSTVRLCLLLFGWTLGVCLLASCQGNGGGTGTTLSDTATAADSTESLPATEPGTETATDAGSETVPATGTETESVTEPATEPSLSVYDVIDRLRTSDYAVSLGKTDDCGLSDPSAVGARQEAFTTVLYPVPADSEVDITVNVGEFGIRPESADNSAALRELLTRVAEMQGSVKLIFPVGTYRFGSTLNFSGQENLYVCSDQPGTPFSILMTQWTPGIRLENTCNIQFSDFTLDYETPSAVWGEVTGGDATAHTVSIRINDAFDLSDSRYNGGKITWGSYMEMYRDEETGKYCPDDTGNLLYNSTGDGIKNIKDGVYDAGTRTLTLTFREQIKLPAEGTVVNVAFTMYENFGFYAKGCENIRLEGAYFYHTTGMAMGMTSCHNVYLNRVFLTPREGMLMTATADGLHCMNCTGDIVVTGCVFEASHDDCMNINGRYLTVKTSAGNTLTLSGLDVPVFPGDVLEVYSKEDLHFVGSFTVTAVDEKTRVLTVAEDTAGAVTDCFAANITQSPTLTVRDCLLGNKRNRGMLIQVRNVTVENCTFRNICHGPVQIFSVPSSFGEGIMPAHVTVQNCKFFRCGATDVNIFSWSASGGTAPGTVQNVTVRNNFFCESTYYPVQVSTGGNVTVADNLFDRIGTRPDSLNPRCSVRVTCSQDVTVRNNWLLPFAKRFAVMNTREAARDARNLRVTEEGSVLLEMR